MKETNVEETPWNDIKFESFNEKELASLTTFHDQVTKILNSKIVQNGQLKCHHEISCNLIEGVWKETTDCPDDEDVAHVLMIARTFMQTSNQTRVDLEHILSILKNKSANDKTHAHFASMEKNYKFYWENSLIRVKNGAKEYTSKHLFDYILNADKFHTDGNKKKLIDDLRLMETTKKAMFFEAFISICEWAKLIDCAIIAKEILPKK